LNWDSSVSETTYSELYDSWKIQDFLLGHHVQTVPGIAQLYMQWALEGTADVARCWPVT